MKFYKIEYILLSLILLCLFNKSNQNEQKKLERILNATKYFIGLMKGKLNASSITLEYKRKYNITIDNLRLIKPLMKNAKISKEINENNEEYYILNNIKLLLLSDLNIKLSSTPRKNITEESFFIETNISEIKFKKINDFNNEFIESKMDYIDLKESEKMAGLKYFNDFNNEKECILYEEGIKPVYVDDIKLKLRELFNKVFEKRMKEIEKSHNLLYYDMTLIFNNATESIVIKNSMYGIIFQITKIITKSNNITLNKTENIINIKYVNIIGSFIPYTEILYNFNLTCKRKNNNYITYKNKGQNKYVDISLNGCDFDQSSRFAEIETEIREEIKSSYTAHLNHNADYYYKNTLELNIYK